MAKEMKVLCVCLGNSDRSPFMKALLEQMLRNQGRTDVTVDSAGVSDSAKKGGPAPKIAQALAPTYGVDLSTHCRKHIDDTKLYDYNLFVVAEKEVQTALVAAGVEEEIICLELHGAANAWMSQNPAKVEAMIHSIYSALLSEVIAYKFRIN